ncbi:hypothetical protein AX17_003723 [Amanita inopinata Kibby_2008]|nr:hypothetical protein AX17_003723 [Amanita inopinata Kibby_2008]
MHSLVRSFKQCSNTFQKHSQRHISTSARRLTTAKRGSAFDFLPSNVLPAKPRAYGLTEIRGPYYAPVTRTYLDELLSDWGEYVDGVKFAGGSFSLMPRDGLRALIDTAHKHDCYVSTGGYIERVLSSSAGNKHVIEKYLQACKDSGFDVLEISSGFLSIPTEDWLSLVELTASYGLKPKPEVGIQWGAGGDAPIEELEAAGTRDPRWLIDRVNLFLQAGADMVMIESEGITENVRNWRTDAISAITSALPKERIMFEAADPKVFSYHIQNQGATANLFIDHSQIVQLACLRKGIWGTGDTFSKIVTFDPSGGTRGSEGRKSGSVTADSEVFSGRCPTPSAPVAMDWGDATPGHRSHDVPSEPGDGGVTYSEFEVLPKAMLAHGFSIQLRQSRYLISSCYLPRIDFRRFYYVDSNTYYRGGGASTMNVYDPDRERDYIPIADHGLIGNLRTAALISLDGSVESYCVPNFDSPSIFARILDKNKGGHFSIVPTVLYSTKQNYLPSSNVLQTKFMNERGVASITDYLPRPRQSSSLGATPKPLLPWLIRRVECVRGSIPLVMECAPAFNYARSSHTTRIFNDDSIIPGPGEPQKKILFESDELTLDLRYVAESTMDHVQPPEIALTSLDLSAKGHLGPASQATFSLVEGQCITFVLRHLTPQAAAQIREAVNPYPNVGIPVERDFIVPVGIGGVRSRTLDDPFLTKELLSSLLSNTNKYWADWIHQSTYTGSWKEAVNRSALALKLLIFEPTGAVIASPTFSLPEYIGGVRNWDYRASWIRDSSFTLYALIRLGFTQEANAYMEFIFERLRHKNPDGSLQIMYTIHGEKELPEIELTHLDGHKGSRPVRIGNGAADHLQLDIYGELMDSIYLGQKFGKPLSYDDWVLVRELVDYVVTIVNQPDLSIWEVRNRKRHFTYSKIMLWVAIDRGIRLADKRSLPCPNRVKWLATRDALYEEIMHRAWDKDGQSFGQSYEETDVLDASVLIMPLVFFMHGSDPRFRNTLKRILKTPERGGLTSNNLVYRYDVSKSSDGIGGEEGTFCLCTLWCVEALTRAGENDRAYLQRAVSMFEDFLLYLNHVGLCTEEISDAGEALGNHVQGFTHVTLISAAYNLSRTLEKARG